MARISLDFYSEALGMQTNVQVVIPQQSAKGEIGIERGKTDGKFKCLYLLHGLSDDQTIWSRWTSIERYASLHGICVVMPMGARSFYSDMKYGANYYTYIAKELPNVIEGMFNVSSDSKDRFIAGQSMGGYGALKIALRESGRYAAAIGLSSVANIHNPAFTGTLKAVFGEEDIPKDADLFELFKEHNSDAVKPRIYMLIGKDDFMYQDNVELKNLVEKLNYDYTYVETEGDHVWWYWDDKIQHALKWMLEEK